MRQSMTPLEVQAASYFAASERIVSLSRRFMFSAGGSRSAALGLVEQEQRVHHLGGDDADADENENKCGSSHGKFLLTNRIFVRV